MIGRKSFLIVISKYLTQIIGLIGVVILAKIWAGFAVEALGIIGFAMSFVALFSIFSDLGFSQAHTKRVSEGKDLGTCIGTFIAIKLILTGLMVSIIFVAIYIWKNSLNGSFTDATTDSIIHVFILYYIFSSLTCIPIKTFAGTRESVKQEIPGIFGRIVKVVGTVVVALAGVNFLSIAPPLNWPEFLLPFQKFISVHPVGSLAMTYVIDMLIVFLVGMWFLIKYPIKKPSYEYFKNYSSYAFPVMFLSAITIISLYTDKIMIGYFWSSTEVGYYFTVQRITEFILILSVSLSTLLFPTISKLHSQNNFELLKKTTLVAERYISMIMIPPIVVIIVFSYPMINIMLDRSFLPAAPVLMILAIYSFVSGMKSPYTSLIHGINKPGIGTKVGFVICSLNIVLNLLFIPKSGILSQIIINDIRINGPTGAAVATVISSLSGLILLKMYSYRLTSIKFSKKPMFLHIFSGFIMGSILYIIAYKTSFFPNIHWYYLFIFSIIGLGIYIAILYLLKEFKKQDLDFFLSILHPKEMLKYVKSELSNKK